MTISQELLGCRHLIEQWTRRIPPSVIWWEFHESSAFRVYFIMVVSRSRTFKQSMRPSIPPSISAFLLPHIANRVSATETALAAWILTCALSGAYPIPTNLVDWCQRRLLDTDTPPGELLSQAIAHSHVAPIADEIQGYLLALYEAIAVCIVAVHSIGGLVDTQSLTWAEQYVDRAGVVPILFQRSIWFSPRLGCTH